MTGAPAGSPKFIDTPPAQNHAELMDALREANRLGTTLVAEGSEWLKKSDDFASLKKPKFVIASLKKANILLQRLYAARNKLETEGTAIASSFVGNQIDEVDNEFRVLTDHIKNLRDRISDGATHINGDEIILANGETYRIYNNNVIRSSTTIAIVLKLERDNAGVVEEKTFNLLEDPVETIQDTPANSVFETRNAARLVLNSGLLLDAGKTDEGKMVNNLFPYANEIETPDTALASVNSRVLRYATGEVVVTTLAFKDKLEGPQITDQLDLQPGTEAHEFFIENNKSFAITTKQVTSKLPSGASINELVIVSIEPIELVIEDALQTLLDQHTGKTLTADLAKEISEELLGIAPTAIRKTVKNDFGIAPKHSRLASKTDILIRRIARGDATPQDEERMKANAELHQNGKPTKWYELSSIDRRIQRFMQGDDHLTDVDQAKIAEQQAKLEAEEKGEQQVSGLQRLGRFFGKFIPWLSTTWVSRAIPSLFSSDKANNKIAAARARTNELVAKAQAGTLTPTEAADNSDIQTIVQEEYKVGSEDLVRTPRTYFRGKEFKKERTVAIAAALAALGIVGADRAYDRYHSAPQPNNTTAARNNSSAAQLGSSQATRVNAAPGFDAGIGDANINDLGSNAQIPSSSTEMDASTHAAPGVIPTANEIVDASVASAHDVPNGPSSIGRRNAPAHAAPQPASIEPTPPVNAQSPTAVQQQPNLTTGASAPLTSRPFFVAGTSSGDVNGALKAHPDQHNDSRERFVVHGVDQILSQVAPGLTAQEHQRAAGGIGHLVDGQITTYLSAHPAAAQRFGRIHHGDHGHIDIEEVANRHGSGTHRVLHIQLQRPDRHGTDHTVLDLKIPESTVQGIIAQHTSVHAAALHHAQEQTARDHHPARRVTQHVRQLGERADTTGNQAVVTPPVTAPIGAPVEPVVPTQTQSNGGVRRVVQHVRRLTETRQVAADRVVDAGATAGAVQQADRNNTGAARAANPQPQALPIVIPTPTVTRPANTATYERNVSRTVDHFYHLSESQKNALQDFVSRFNTQISSLPGEDSGNMAASLEYNSQGHPVLDIDISMDNHGRVRAQIPFLVVRRADGSIDLETDTRAAILPRAHEEDLNTSLISFGIAPTTQADRSLHLDRINTGIYGIPRVGKHNPMDRALRSVLRQVRLISYVAATTTTAAQISTNQPYETNPTAREAIIGALMTAIRETLNTRPFGHTPRQPAVDRLPNDSTDIPAGDPNDPLGIGDLGLKADRRVVDDAERDRLLREIDQMFNNPPSQPA